MCDYVMCFRVLCVLWAQGQVGQVLLVQWVPTTPTHIILDRLGPLGHHSQYLQLMCNCLFSLICKCHRHLKQLRWGISIINHLFSSQWRSSRSSPIQSSGLEQHLPAVAAPGTSWPEWVTFDFTFSPGFQESVFISAHQHVNVHARLYVYCTSPSLCWWSMAFFSNSGKISRSTDGNVVMRWLCLMQLWLTLSLFPPWSPSPVSRPVAGAHPHPMRTSPPPPCIFSRQGSSQWRQCSLGSLLRSVLPAAIRGCASPVPCKSSWRCPNIRGPDPDCPDTRKPARLHQSLGGVLQEDGWDSQTILSVTNAEIVCWFKESVEKICQPLYLFSNVLQ